MGEHNDSKYRQAVLDEASRPEAALCPCCLGVLQRLPCYAEEIRSAVHSAAFEVVDFNLSLLLPALLYIRQWAMWHHLTNSSATEGRACEGVVELKEVVKWLLPDTLQSMLEAQHSTRSKVMLELNWDHPLGLAEAAFVAKFDQQLRARRTRHNKGGKRRRGEAVVPAQAIARRCQRYLAATFAKPPQSPLLCLSNAALWSWGAAGNPSTSQEGIASTIATLRKAVG